MLSLAALTMHFHDYEEEVVSFRPQGLPLAIQLRVQLTETEDCSMRTIMRMALELAHA